MIRHETLAGLPAVHVTPETPSERPPVLLFHGIGLGSWLWERDQQILAELGLESWALQLPGHGDGAGARMDDCYTAGLAAARELGECMLVGHSAGGLVAQVVADQHRVEAVVLVAAVPCREVFHYPTRMGLRTIAPHLATLARGRALPMSKQDYLDTGLDMLPPEEQDRAWSRMVPWPNGMVRDMALRRPSVPPLECPVLATHGGRDQVARLYVSRLLADHFGGILWRFDDLAHLPQLEPGGERHARAYGEWLLAPRRPKVREISAFSPDEGVGDKVRRGRRGGGARSNSRFRKR